MLTTNQLRRTQIDLKATKQQMASMLSFPVTIKAKDGTPIANGNKYRREIQSGERKITNAELFSLAAHITLSDKKLTMIKNKMEELKDTK